MTLIKRFLAIIALVALMASVECQASDIPALRGRVNDYANLLSPTAEQKLEETLRLLEKKTSAQVVVLTMKNLGGEDINDFSLRTVESWKIGYKDKDNGLLITYAASEDIYRIEVGYGLEGAIPDGLAGEIIQKQLRGHADPKKGLTDFDGGFMEAVERISSIITNEYEQDPSGKSMQGFPAKSILILLGVVFVISGISGNIHPFVGGLTGSIGAGFVSVYFLFPVVGVIAMCVIGFLVGLISTPILEALLANGGSGGSFGDSDGGSSGGGFSGGGGSFGGGGARG